MFVVCKELHNKMLRVVDTDDWTEEVISVVQLKLLETMGYSFIFDERYNFISKLFLTSVLSDTSFNNMESLGFRVPYTDERYLRLYGKSRDSNIETHCFFGGKDIILFNIRRNGDAYKLSYKIHSKKLLDGGEIVTDSLQLRVFSSTRHKDGYYIELRYYVDDEDLSVRFDLDCNQTW